MSNRERERERQTKGFCIGLKAIFWPMEIHLLLITSENCWNNPDQMNTDLLKKKYGFKNVNL